MQPDRGQRGAGGGCALLMNDARLDEYGRNARKYFEAHFDKKMLLDRFDECVRAGG